MAFKRLRRAQEVPDVDLIPVMNLFVTLIPFLLLAAAFYHVGVIPTSLPAQTVPSADSKPNLRSVTVNLRIAEDHVRVTAANIALEQEMLDGMASTIDKAADGTHDLPALGRVLRTIKEKFPESDTVIVLPTPDVQYQDVVRVLDTTREYRTQGPDGERKLPLFPVVVLSKMVLDEGG